MTTCPKCSRSHKGPRSHAHVVAQLRSMLNRIDGWDEARAASFLRMNLRLLNGELENLCADCRWSAAAQGHAAAMAIEVLESPAPREETLPSNVYRLRLRDFHQHVDADADRLQRHDERVRADTLEMLAPGADFYTAVDADRKA